jgi:hypothetical protein
VIDEAKDETVALRAEYAMAEVHQALGDYESADRLMTQIIQEHPESVFADRARVTLGIEIDAERSDTLEVVLDRYSQAYRHWNQGQLQEALNSMIRTAADYPRTDVAAKAMLASAAIFSDMARTDSLDLFGLIPLGDSLFTSEEVDRATAGLAVDSVSVDSAVVSDTLLTTVGPQDTTVAAALEDRPAEPDSQRAEQEAFVPAKPVAELAREEVQEGQVQERADSTAAEDLVAAAADSTHEASAEPSTEPATKGKDEEDLLQVTEARTDVQNDDDLLLGRRQAQNEVQNQGDGAKVVDDVPRAVAGVDTADVVSPADQIDTTDVSLPADQIAVADSTLEATGVEAALPDQVLADADSASQIQENEPEAVAEAPEPPEWIDAEYYINDIIPQPLTLHSLFASVEEHFADSEFGTRASELKRGLVAYRDEVFARPDTTSPQAKPAPMRSNETASVSDSSMVSIEN